MAILNETKEELNHQLGAPSKAGMLVGGDNLFQVDEAWRYTLGRFIITVGFYQSISRYVCFYKDRDDDPAFDDRDVDVSLALVAPGLSWSTVERDSSITDPENEPNESETQETPWLIAEYKTSITDTGGPDVGIIAYHRTRKPHFLAYTEVKTTPEIESTHGAMESAGTKLDALLLDLNTAARAETKMDAIVAVINELVAQHKTIREQMPKIRERRND